MRQCVYVHGIQVVYVSCSCVSATLNISQTSKLCFVWCLSFWGNRFIRESVLAKWAPSGLEWEKQTDRLTDRLTSKIITFTDIGAKDVTEQETEWNKLPYNSTAEYLVYLCLFWSAKHICRPPIDTSASQQDGAWFCIVTCKSAIWILARMSSFKKTVSRKYYWVPSAVVAIVFFR